MLIKHIIERKNRTIISFALIVVIIKPKNWCEINIITLENFRLNRRKGDLIKR
jgi:hypothetical protein